MKSLCQKGVSDLLFVRQLKHLLMIMKTTEGELANVLSNKANFVRRLRIVSSGKEREVLNVVGDLRVLQKSLYQNLLLPKLRPSIYSHGAVRGRSILTNVAPHLCSESFFIADITSFYRSIHYTAVYKLFVGPLGCSPDVASICTKIATFDHHLALGMITSPILANQILFDVDRRLGAMCDKDGMNYSRFVDDITISAPFDLSSSGFPRLVQQVLNQQGFRLNPKKVRFVKRVEQPTVTGIRIVNRQPDIPREYLRQVWHDLLNAERISKGQPSKGRVYMRRQLIGRIKFICWVNPSRRRKFRQKFASIDWRKFEIEAERQGLIRKC